MIRSPSVVTVALCYDDGYWTRAIPQFSQMAQQRDPRCEWFRDITRVCGDLHRLIWAFRLSDAGPRYFTPNPSRDHAWWLR